MEWLLLAINLLLALGLLSPRWHRMSGIAVCVWSAGAGPLVAAQGRWGWAVFYGFCGFGGLLLLSVPGPDRQGVESPTLQRDEVSESP